MYAQRQYIHSMRMSNIHLSIYHIDAMRCERCCSFCCCSKCILTNYSKNSHRQIFDVFWLLFFHYVHATEHRQTLEKVRIASNTYEEGRVIFFSLSIAVLCQILLFATTSSSTTTIKSLYYLTASNVLTRIRETM